jgi:hypothetical protein
MTCKRLVSHVWNSWKGKKKLQERLVGLWFSMEDRMAKFVKVQSNMQEVETSLFKLKEKPQDQVFIMSTDSICIMN